MFKSLLIILVQLNRQLFDGGIFLLNPYIYYFLLITLSFATFLASSNVVTFVIEEFVTNSEIILVIGVIIFVFPDSGIVDKSPVIALFVVLSTPTLEILGAGNLDACSLKSLSNV